MSEYRSCDECFDIDTPPVAGLAVSMALGRYSAVITCARACVRVIPDGWTSLLSPCSQRDGKRGVHRMTQSPTLHC